MKKMIIDFCSSQLKVIANNNETISNNSFLTICKKEEEKQRLECEAAAYKKVIDFILKKS